MLGKMEGVKQCLESSNFGLGFRQKVYMGSAFSRGGNFQRSRSEQRHNVEATIEASTVGVEVVWASHDYPQPRRISRG